MYTFEELEQLDRTNQVALLEAFKLASDIANKYRSNRQVSDILYRMLKSMAKELYKKGSYDTYVLYELGILTRRRRKQVNL